VNVDRLSDFIYTRSRLIIAFVVVMNLIALASLTRFAIDTDITGFFTAGNKVYDEYLALTEKYDISESVVVLIEDTESLLAADNMLAVHELVTAIEALPEVREVQSFLPSEYPAGNLMMAVDERFIERHYEVLRDFTRQRHSLADELLSSDEGTGLISITLKHDADGEEVVEKLERIVDRTRGVSISLAGDPVIGTTLEWYLWRIILLLPPAAGSLVLLVFYRMLRNKRLTLLSMLPAAFGTLWTFGTVFLQGEAVNVVTAISPIFILVMGSADGLHYTTHLLEKLSLHPDRRILTRETMRMVLKPIVLTSVTTMAGFGSLAWSDLVPLRQMGIYVPLGIGYACFLSVFFLPALLTRIHLPAERPPEGDGLLSFFVSLRRRRGVIFAGVVLLLGIAVINLPQLKVVTDPLLYFKEDSAIRKTFRTVEDTFGGALVIIGEIPATCGLDTLRSADCAESVLDMERELERMPGVLSVRSLFDVVQTAHELQSGLLGYPESPGEVSLILDAMDDDDLASWYSADGIRLVARTSRLDSEDVEALLRFRDAHPELRTLNGTPVLYNEMNRLTVRSQVQSLALALALVFLMLAAGFKEPRAALFALVPIGLTIVAILAALVVTGYNLNMVTATLSAVTVGVGVDYAIHLISGIQYYRAQGLAMADAVDTALFSVSRPVLASAFGLCAGISVMFLSPLHIHSQVATVMWVAMTVSSLGALALIPLFYTIRHCS
jgi:predicted RND superfamily exporter protein